MYETLENKRNMNSMENIYNKLKMSPSLTYGLLLDINISNHYN